MAPLPNSPTDQEALEVFKYYLKDGGCTFELLAGVDYVKFQSGELVPFNRLVDGTASKLLSDLHAKFKEIQSCVNNRSNKIHMFKSRMFTCTCGCCQAIALYSMYYEKKFMC